jgi:hypothetical protein
VGTITTCIISLFVILVIVFFHHDILLPISLFLPMFFCFHPLISVSSVDRTNIRYHHEVDSALHQRIHQYSSDRSTQSYRSHSSNMAPNTRNSGKKKSPPPGSSSSSSGSTSSASAPHDLHAQVQLVLQGHCGEGNGQTSKT